MDLSTQIDIYCERTDPSLFAEPLNLFSNLAFVVAGWWCLRQTSVLPQRFQHVYRILCWMVISIGIGSGLFHSFATMWAQAADVIPIGVFLLTYIGVWGGYVAGYRAAGMIGLFAIFALWSTLFAIVLDKMTWNGSNTYFGTWFMLLVLAADSRRRELGMERAFLGAAVAFALSLTFRTIDMRLCPQLAIGTHFLWHLCNGLTIFVVMRALQKRFMDHGNAQ